jgi:hypothetical protein
VVPNGTRAYVCIGPGPHCPGPSTAYGPTFQVSGYSLLDLCMKASGLFARGLPHRSPASSGSARTSLWKHDGEEQPSLKYSVYLSEVIGTNRLTSCHLKSYVWCLMVPGPTHWPRGIMARPSTSYGPIVLLHMAPPFKKPGKVYCMYA